MELLVYKASAGSGKTFTLAVEYIKHLIINPRAYRQILAVTFTNKATAEMKERILTQLYGIWKGAPSSEAYLERIKNYKLKIKEEGGDRLTDGEIRQRAGMALQYMLHDYSRFRVETIDSFFQSVMRNLARELELSPNLNIELNNSEVLSDAVDSLIEKLTPTSPVLAWLLDYIDERIRDDKRWNVSNEVKSFGRNIFDESYIERGEKLRQCLRTPNTLKLYRDVLRDMETEALEQMKSFYDQFEGELEGHALTPEDLKGGARGIGSYFRKLRDGRLSDKDVLNATLQNSLADAKNWATKTSSRKDDIICLAETSLMPLLQEAERMRPQRNRTLNSCRLSLQHLNKLQLLNHIDEEVRTLNREHNRFLLSDTNALLHKLVREGDSSFVFEKIGANIRNVMIDEFQDTSQLQIDMSARLAGPRCAHLCTVGDAQQSIYRFRGATIENILNFERVYPGTKTIRLEQNYRSTSNILNAANCVIQHNTERKGKTLWTKNGEGDKVQVYTAENEQDEASHIADVIGQHLKEGGHLADHAILYRMNAQSAPIESYFTRAGIPHKIVGGQRFNDRKEVKYIHSYMSIVANPRDDVRLRRIINEPARKIGATTIEVIADLAAQQGISMLDVISHADQYAKLSRAIAPLFKFWDIYQKLQESLETKTLDEFASDVIEITGYRALLEADAAKGHEDAADRLQNLGQLVNNVKNYCDQHGEEATLEGYLEDIALISDIENRG